MLTSNSLCLKIKLFERLLKNKIQTVSSSEKNKLLSDFNKVYYACLETDPYIFSYSQL